MTSVDRPSVRVFFFGATAAAVKLRERRLDLDRIENVGDALNKLVKLYPRLSDHRLLVALNEEYVSPETTLEEGDELAIFTAVSGG